MLDKLGKVGRTIVNLFFAFMSLFIIVSTLKEEGSIGVKIIVLILCGGFLWYSISELKDDWKKEE